MIFLIATTIAIYTFGQGKQKQLGDLLIFFSSLFLVRRFKEGKFSTRLFSIITIGTVLVGALGLIVVMSQRCSLRGIDLSSANDASNPNMQIDLHHQLFEYVSPSVGFPLAMPFKWTYMVGGSYSLPEIFNQYRGFPLCTTIPILLASA